MTADVSTRLCEALSGAGYTDARVAAGWVTFTGDGGPQRWMVSSGTVREYGYDLRQPITGGRSAVVTGDPVAALMAILAGGE